MKAEKSDHEKGGGAKDDKSSDEEEFLGFSPSTDKVSLFSFDIFCILQWEHVMSVRKGPAHLIYAKTQYNNFP